MTHTPRQLVVWIIAALILAFMALYSSLPAQTGQACGPLAVVAGHLKRKFGEDPVALGTIDGGNRFIVTASTRGTWTALIWRPGDVVCPITGGTGYWQRRLDQRVNYAPR